jgi:hypothetical protein
MRLIEMRFGIFLVVSSTVVSTEERLTSLVGPRRLPQGALLPEGLTKLD